LLARAPQHAQVTGLSLGRRSQIRSSLNYARAGLAHECGVEVHRVGDDALLAAAFKVLNYREDFWTHAAFVELILAVKSFRFG
jgi:hypothetical protein